MIAPFKRNANGNETTKQSKRTKKTFFRKNKTRKKKHTE